MTKSIRKKNRRLKRQTKGDDPHIQSEGYYPRKKRAEEMTAVELESLKEEINFAKKLAPFESEAFKMARRKAENDIKDWLDAWDQYREK